MESAPVALSAAVEGQVDEAVLRRLVALYGATLHAVHGRTGKRSLVRNLAGYNAAAHHAPWVVLLDLDRDADCAVTAIADWLPQRSPQLCLRVAVRAVESWLLADAVAVACFLGVRAARVPSLPEALLDPKRSLVDLARESRKESIRRALVPRPKSGRPVGAEYTPLICEFAARRWDPARASGRSPSLARALRCLERLVGVESAIARRPPGRR